MRPRVKAKLAHHRPMLVGEMKPLPMFGSLIENNVLTPAHLDKILPDDERKELNEKLLDIIPTRGDAAFTVLGEGLEASLQGHLAYLLDPEGKEDPDEKKEEEDGKEKKTSPKKKIGQLTRQISRMGSRSSMRPESREQLTKHKATLVSEMQPLPLFGLLIQNNILSRDMVDGILSPEDQKKVNERLVDILPDRPDSAYKMFIYALRGNGQGQLVEVLEGDIKPNKYRRESDTGVDKTPAKMSRDSMGAAKSAFESVYGSRENVFDDGKKQPVSPGPGWKSTATPDRSPGSRPSSRPSSTSKEKPASQSSEDGEAAAKRKLSEYSATPPRQERDWKNVERDNEDLRRRRSSIDARKLTMIRTGMKVKQRQLIFANRPAIVDSIQLDSVLDHMVKEGEFTQSQADDLRKMPFRFTRNSRFVDLLLTKGSHNYNTFCDALRDSDQLELARVMEPGRWTGTEYSPAKLPDRKDEPAETTPKKKWKPSTVSDKSPATKRKELQEKYGAAESVPDVRLEEQKRKAKERELKEKAVATEKEETEEKKKMKDVGVGKTPPPVRKFQTAPPVEKLIETEETKTEKVPKLTRQSGVEVGVGKKEEVDGPEIESKPPKSPPTDVKRKTVPERSAFVMKPDSPPPVSEVDMKTPSPTPKIAEKTPSPTREVVMKTPSPPPQASPKAGKKHRSPPPETELTFSPKTYGAELESPSPVKKPTPLKTVPKTPSPPPEVLLESPKSPPKSLSRPTVELVIEDEEVEEEERPVTIGKVLDDRKRKAEEIRLKMQERKKSLKREDEEKSIKIVSESNRSSPGSNGESVTAAKEAYAVTTTKISVTTTSHTVACQSSLSAQANEHQSFIQVHPTEDEGIEYGEIYGVEYELVEEETPGEVRLVQFDYPPPSPPPLRRDDEILVSTTPPKSSPVQEATPPVNRAPSPPKENDYGVIFDYPKLVTITNVPSDRVPPPSPPEQTATIAEAEPVVRSAAPSFNSAPPPHIADYPKLNAKSAPSTHAPPPPPSSITNSSKRSTPESYISEDFPPMMMESAEYNALVAGTPSPAQYSPVVALPSGQKKKLGVSQEVYKSLNSLSDLRKNNGKDRRRRNTDSPPVIVDQVYGRPIKVLPTTMDHITPETERQMKQAAQRIAKSERLLQVMKQLSDRTLSHACQCEKLEDPADKDLAELVQTGTTVRPGGDILIDKLSDELQDLYKQRPGVFNKQPGPWYRNVNTAMRDTYNTLIIHLVHMKASLNDLSKAMEEYKKDNQLKNAYLARRKEGEENQR
ncbi:PREDICTED: proteoglycan 4-like [Branchiostoma belcheri]|uniref:Proteoglycan 4-like n=1 Tax=Branchiostoma belcheri TaxID=7741 RepID=A0A6P4YWR7_BRABE|nr:PREDICTED: proteoglycan 4-like [Branchiostoma belcheri]